MKQIYFFFLLLPLLFGGNRLYSQEQVKSQLEAKPFADGPYVVYLPDGKVRIISTDTVGKVSDVIMNEMPQNFTLSVTSHAGKHHFNVGLHPIQRQAWKSPKPAKLFVISDPHGNLDCFVSVLRGNNVINDNYEWMYGKNHLMIIGDVFDRGKDVLPIFWLIYKLEKEAQDAGGQVSFLLGNHEPMVLAADYRYTEPGYINFAKVWVWTTGSYLDRILNWGRWLATRNTMQVIGKDLFVHAGLSKEFLEAKLSIPQVNEEMSKALNLKQKERNALSPLTKFLYGGKGPIWYRGMVENEERYFPLHVDILDELLKTYGVGRIIVGHTIFPDVRTFYNGRVILVNVDNSHNFRKVLGREF